MSEPDIPEIKKRYEAATDGPWFAQCKGYKPQKWWRIQDKVTGYIAEVSLDGPPGENGDNAVFIAHARTDIPALVTALEEAQGRGKFLWRTLEEWLLLQRIFGGSASEEHIISLERQLAEAKALLSDLPDHSDLDAAVFEANALRRQLSEAKVKLSRIETDMCTCNRGRVGMCIAHDKNSLLARILKEEK